MNGAPPPTVPGLVIGDVLGAGGFATTWAARDGDAERVVKVGHQGGAAQRARFEREAMIQAGLDARGHRLAVDADTALRLLAADGILAERGAGFGFRDPTLAQAAARAMPAERTAVLHRVVLELARARRDRPRIARHGAAAGAAGEAAAAWIDLGVVALDAGRVTDAERLLTQAIDTAGAPPALVRTARIHRGRARYLQDRAGDAIADLAAAASEAELAGAVEQAAAAGFELATAHDLGRDPAAAAAAVRAARRVLGDRGGFELALALADARQRWRDGDDTGAAAALAVVVADARRAGDRNAEVVAMVMLGPTRVSSGDLAGAATAFEDALLLCARRGDGFHAAAVYANRLYLREATGDVDGAIADLEASRRLARQSGLAITEGVVLHNLAELHLRAGRDDDEVLHMAERAHLLYERFVTTPPAASDLLVARIHAARGDLAAAAPYLVVAAQTARDHQSTAERLQLDVLTDRAGPTTLADAASMAPEEELEIVYWLLRQDPPRVDRAALVDRALQLVTVRPIWRRRLEALGIMDQGCS